MNVPQPLYCSLDLELTGFDPLKDEILEIGFAFFKPGPNGLEVTQQWSQVFQPSVEVHPKILGLTGITQEELAGAPKLAEFHQELQNKLGQAIIVGHNIGTDIRFLEAFGLKLSGQSIDTLELAQFLLPTHHSYNLENLMHYFQVDHSGAHRALADSLAVIAILEKYRALYQSFPQELRNKIDQLVQPYQFMWPALLASPVKAQLKVVESVPDTTLPAAEVLSADQIIMRPFDETSPDGLAKIMISADKKIFVVPDKAVVLRLWQNSGMQGVFAPDDLFNEEKFNHLLAQAGSPEEILFCLKVLVWQYTNWQTQTVLDLNVSFAGGQFLPLISGSAMKAVDTDQPLVCTYEAWAVLAEQQLYSDRSCVIWTMHRFEQWLASGNRSRLSWNQISYILKSVFNPETSYGRLELREQVLAALGAADLFFGLVNLLLSREFPGQATVSYEQLVEREFVFNRIRTAAQNFQQKLLLLVDQASLAEAETFIAALLRFFDDAPARIKWIEVRETNCMFFNQPLQVANLAQQLIAQFTGVQFIENLPLGELVNYLALRLGLTSPDSSIFSPLNHRVVISYEPGHSPVALLQPDRLPAAVIFSDLIQVKDFYNEHYAELTPQGRVFAQGYSGGSNKIFRNFGITEHAILVASSTYVARQTHRLAVKTVIINGLSPVEMDHPYMQALQKHWVGQFPRFAELQASYHLFLLLQVFYSERLEYIYILTTGQPLSTIQNCLSSLV